MIPTQISLVFVLLIAQTAEVVEADIGTTSSAAIDQERLYSLSCAHLAS
jgi:hypothetical protein